MRTPRLFVVAGPNGAGKSTAVKLPQVADLLGETPIVNPDNIAFQIDPVRRNAEAVQIQAGQIAFQQRQANLAARRSLLIETTLSGHSEINLMRNARDGGFTVHLFYIGLDEACLSRWRVEERVIQGGHSVPRDAIERRYPRTMANLARALEIADTARVYDNSIKGYELLLKREHGEVRYLASDLPEWAAKAIPARFLVSQHPSAG
ncbi:MAG: zeta toxin family protein [Alphaproteobacteria bacterium]|nr:zeta toxin family protein [Alphaproteobacteria bacterium]